MFSCSVHRQIRFQNISLTLKIYKNKIDTKNLISQINFYQQKMWRNYNTWSLKDILHGNSWIKKIKKQGPNTEIHQTNDNEKINYHNICDTAKVVIIREKFIGLNAYRRSEEKQKINLNLL